MKTSSTIPACLAEFDEPLVTLCDGRPGLRRPLPVTIHQPTLHSAFCSLHSECGDSSLNPRKPETPGGPPSPGGEGRGEGELIPHSSFCNLHSSLSTPDSEPPILDFISSDESLDRYDEILVASGWRLDNYRRNPVFQNAHQYGDIVFTLGRALETEVRDGRLYQRIEFATAVNPIARIAYGLYKGKFLNAVSVGFIPIRWEYGDGDAGYRRKYIEQELLEVSAVGIPANPNALALGLKSGAIEKNDLEELLDLLHGLCESISRAPALETPGGILPLHLSQSHGSSHSTGKECPLTLHSPLCTLHSEEGRGEGEPTLHSAPCNLHADEGEPILHSSFCNLHFCSHPAAPNPTACASGIRRNEALWLQLARDIRDVIRET